MSGDGEEAEAAPGSCREGMGPPKHTHTHTHTHTEGVLSALTPQFYVCTGGNYAEALDKLSAHRGTISPQQRQVPF